MLLLARLSNGLGITSGVGQKFLHMASRCSIAPVIENVFEILAKYSGLGPAEHECYRRSSLLQPIDVTGKFVCLAVPQTADLLFEIASELEAVLIELDNAIGGVHFRCFGNEAVVSFS